MIGAETLLKVAMNPRDHHKYAEDAQPDQAATEAAVRRAAWSARRVFKQNASTSSHERLIKCQLCQDRRYVMLASEWLEQDRPTIPHDAVSRVAFFVQMNPVRGCVHVAGPDEFMVPCDCHSGLCESGTEPKPVQRFADIFGRKLAEHPFGQAIIRYRRSRYDADKARQAEAVMAEHPLKRGAKADPAEGGPIVHVEAVDVTEAPAPSPGPFADHYEYQEYDDAHECPF